jgi:hypothetical protein
MDKAVKSYESLIFVPEQSARLWHAMLGVVARKFSFIASTAISAPSPLRNFYRSKP